MKKLMFLFAAALMMVACSNEEIATNDDVQYVSELKLNFGKGDSRVAATHSAAGLNFAWEEGDEIRVYEDGDPNAIPIYYNYDKNSESFKPKYESYKMEVGQEYFAVRGQRSTNIPLSLADGDIVVKMDSEADGSGLPAIPMITDVFTAKSNGTIATMHHLMGVVEIPVKLDVSSTEVEAKQFKLYSNGGKLAREFTAKPKSPYLNEVSEAYTTAVSEEKTYVLSKDEATSVFIPVLPGTHNSVQLTYCWGDASNRTTSLGINITVERGKITKINEETITLD